LAYCNLIRQEIAKQFAKKSAKQIAKSQQNKTAFFDVPAQLPVMGFWVLVRC